MLKLDVWKPVAILALFGASNLAVPTVLLADGYSGPSATHTDPALVRVIQRKLKEQGFYKGNLDGQIGPATRSALTNFRASRGIAAPVRNDSWYNRNMALDENLIRALFGLTGYGGSGVQSEVRLMKKLGIKPTTSEYREIYDFYDDYFGAGAEEKETGTDMKPNDDEGPAGPQGDASNDAPSS